MTGYEVYVMVRDRKGMKDSHIANAAGIPASTFSDWKKGKSKPKEEKLQKIADVLGVPMDYLRTGDVRYLYREYAKEVEVACSQKDKMLLDAFNKADDLTQQMVLRLLGLEQDTDLKSSKEA